MTEREKMIEIVLDTEITGIKLRNITGGISTANAIADALIEAEIGDVSEYKKTSNHWLRLYSECCNELANKDLLLGRMTSNKHRAEVAERAFDNTMKVFHEILSAMFPDTKIDFDKWKKDNLANAEKELAEERE